jgi:anti-anti-sigma factor
LGNLLHRTNPRKEGASKVATAPKQAHPELELHESVQPGRRTLTLAGGLDFATTRRFDEAIGRICADDVPELLLDLRKLSFIDSYGLSALLRARANCERRHCRFLLTHERPQIRRLFALTDTAWQFRFLA